MVQRRQPVADRPEDAREAPWAGHRTSQRRRRAARRRCRARRARDAARPDREARERALGRCSPSASRSSPRPPDRARPVAPIGAAAGPSIPGLGELERTRDRLAARLGELRARAARRSEHERDARELLERMRLEPGRYRYYRVPVRDLGGDRLRRLRSAPADGPDRDARRLVAAHAVIRLSIRAGAAPKRGPGSRFGLAVEKGRAARPSRPAGRAGCAAPAPLRPSPASP